MPDAAGYIVERSIAVRRGSSLGGGGTPILDPGQVSWEDRSGLDPRRYYYSVVALSGAAVRAAKRGGAGATMALSREGAQASTHTTVAVSVVRAITIPAALEQGLIDHASAARPRDTIQLAPHPLGTDSNGRDILARLMHGARLSLFFGVVAPLLSVVLGVLYGGLSGFAGGRLDDLVMRFADFVVALPFLLTMIVLQVLFGIESTESAHVSMLAALVILGWPSTARLVRGQVLQIREESYVAAARLIGAGTTYLIVRHMIPNTMGVVLVSLTFAVPSVIFTEAFLSFIGMGVRPPTPSWGSMCQEGILTMRTSPHELLAPAVLISITVLAFNLLGDGLRDALDMRLRGI